MMAGLFFPMAAMEKLQNGAPIFYNIPALTDEVENVLVNQMNGTKFAELWRLTEKMAGAANDDGQIEIVYDDDGK